MKIVSLFSGIAIASSLIAVSCDNAKKDSSTPASEMDTVVSAPPADTMAAGNNGKVVITKEEVPAKVVTAFTKKAPAAKNVQYSKREKVNDAGTDTAVHYYIDYDRNDYAYWLVYNEEGKIIEDHSYTKIQGLPDPVSQAIAEYFPGYKVVEIDKDNDKDILQYEVQMERGELKRKVKFLADGGMNKIK